MTDYLITIDNKRLEDFGLRLEEGQEHPATAQLNQNTLKIPGRSGLWHFGTEIMEKNFSFPIATNGINRAELQQRFNSLVVFLCDEFGKPREVVLKFDYEPDKFYRAKLSEHIVPDMLKPFTRFALSFVAYDPYKYSNTFADEVTWGSEVITFEYHYLLGREGVHGAVKVTGPQTINIPVDGLAVHPIFEINGSANNLTISANGYSFTLPNFTNTSWIIDFEKFVVYRNGQDTMIEIRDFILMPGNNEVKITGRNINIDLRIKYRDKFN